jgi:hypothetical protein
MQVATSWRDTRQQARVSRNRKRGKALARSLGVRACSQGAHRYCRLVGRFGMAPVSVLLFRLLLRPGRRRVRAWVVLCT